jgi:hypothetical protein
MTTARDIFSRITGIKTDQKGITPKVQPSPFIRTQQAQPTTDIKKTLLEGVKKMLGKEPRASSRKK